MPVPTAVPPSGSSPTRGSVASSRSTPRDIWAAYPPNSCPSVTGVASIRWVRPLLTTSANSSALRAKRRLEVAQRRDEVAYDLTRRCEMDRRREDVVGRLRRVDVVVGVHVAPEATRGEGRDDLVRVHVGRRARSGLEDVDRELVVVVAARDLGRGVVDRVGEVRVEDAELSVGDGAGALDAAPARRSAHAAIGRPEIGKFSTARWVWARHRASRGTCDVPHRVVLGPERVAHDPSPIPPSRRTTQRPRRVISPRPLHTQPVRRLPQASGPGPLRVPRRPPQFP